MGDTHTRGPLRPTEVRLKYGPPFTEQLAALAQRVEKLEATLEAVAAEYAPPPLVRQRLRNPAPYLKRIK